MLVIFFPTSIAETRPKCCIFSLDWTGRCPAEHGAYEEVFVVSGQQILLTSPHFSKSDAVRPSSRLPDCIAGCLVKVWDV
ncbi:hypothetical protein GN956_G144 [Arapaima gigas]